MRRVTPVLLLLCLCSLYALALGAQGQLLRNPGMQGNYYSVREGEKRIVLPEGWQVWLAPQSGEYLDRSDKVDIQPHPGPGPDPKEGSRAINVDCGYVTCTVAVYQQVGVAAGSNVTASAWTQVKACNPGSGGTCGSAIESGSQTRIGIDPNGGNNPNDGDIVWSNWSQPHDQWKQLSVSATTTGSTATLFLYSTQGSVAHINKSYWDGASLTGGGPGGSVAGGGEVAAVAAPPPTVALEVPFVAPQRAEDDGSIVHVVRPGNTIDSIAVAYDLTRPRLLALNPGITNPRIISIGQEIIVRRAGGGAGREERQPEAAAPDEELAPETEAGTVAETVVRSAGPVSRRAVASEVGADHAPAPVSVAALPARDPLAMSASVCVTLFEDANSNRLREPNETALANGLLLLTGGGGDVRMATGTEASCFEELAAGAYLLQVDAPAGYGLTAPGLLQLSAASGARLDIAVGAAAGRQPLEPPPPDEVHVFGEDMTQDTSAPPLEIILGNIGYAVFALAGLVLLAGGALTLTLWRR